MVIFSSSASSLFLVCIAIALAITSIILYLFNLKKNSKQNKNYKIKEKQEKVDEAFDLLHQDLSLSFTSSSSSFFPQTKKEGIIETIQNFQENQITKSIQTWILTFQQGDETGVIELAKLYLRGMHPTTRPNKIVGGRICHYVQSSPLFSKGAKLETKELLRNEMFYEYTDPSAGHNELPTEILDTLLQSEPQTITKVVNIVQMTPIQGRERERERDRVRPRTQNQYQNNHDWDLFDVNEVDVEQQQILMQQIEVAMARTVQRRVGDSQNVHSSSVQNGASIALSAFERGETEREYNQQPNIDFKNYVRSRDLDEIKPAEKENMIRVYDSLLQDVKHTKYDRSEKEVFDTMWNRVSRDRDPNLMTAFCRAMGSAVENGAIVCSTGKIVRMIGSIDGLTEDAPNLRPEWALDTELAQLAVRVRSEFEGSRVNNENNENNEDNEDRVSAEMRKKFKQEAENTYKDLISKDILEAKIDVFSQGF
jgi:hypothetical protein